MATPSSICYSIITSIFAAAAFLLCWAAEFECRFVSFTSTSGFTRPVEVQFGIWTHQSWTVATSIGGSVIFESCHKYPSSGFEVDGSLKAARAFSTLALIFGGVYLFANLISSCVAPLRNTPRSEAPAFLMACVFQGLSFLVLHSSVCKNNSLIEKLKGDAAKIGNADMTFPETCSLSVGGKCAIAATVFWFVAALMSSMGVVAENREEKEDEPTATTEPLIPGENL
eukprot:CAMPEP_0172533420 /NCGR_PEP_ID=MMETSP1067-20121228/6135_1 /TAXON_ID=265564 ORGANISM="Thalassiosira punctigera, Strain Tpunct2005C2" /NCGR_SAMPLE_ID=MMETSP1067 /ASSEMBLY_ACC=CAM_ASM_000444 /LENGTH=226 /DNA_ID=CAMNT_0013318065 /DNA_START=184 /DNA_END=864 /DNA_ORIENTATION=-